MMVEGETEAKYFTDTNACSCPDFQYRGHERPCKHIRAYREALEIVASVERKWETRSNSAESERHAQVPAIESGPHA